MKDLDYAALARDALAGAFDELALFEPAPARTSATRWGALTARQRV
jgi:hypothetical protein